MIANSVLAAISEPHQLFIGCCRSLIQRFGRSEFAGNRLPDEWRYDFTHLWMEREWRRAREQVALIFEHGVIAANTRILRHHQWVVEGCGLHDTRPGHGPLRLYRWLADELEPQQCRFLVVGRVWNTKGATIIVADVACASLSSVHHTRRQRRQRYTYVADDRRAGFIGGDPGGILAVHQALSGAARGKAG